MNIYDVSYKKYGGSVALDTMCIVAANPAGAIERTHIEFRKQNYGSSLAEIVSVTKARVVDGIQK